MCSSDLAQQILPVEDLEKVELDVPQIALVVAHRRASIVGPTGQ